MFLAHISLEETRISGKSLVDIVKEIRELLKEKVLSLQVFEEGLFNSGYLDSHSNLYKNLFYNIRECNLFKVINGFPRIIEKDLLNGVGDVRYSITVSECKHFEVNYSDILVNIQEGMI